MPLTDRPRPHPEEADGCLLPSARPAPVSPSTHPPQPHIAPAGWARGRGGVGKRPCGGARAAVGAELRGGAPCPLCRLPSVGLDVSRELRASPSEPERERRRAAGGRGGEEARRGREAGKQGGREGGEEDPESARQLEFLQRLAGLQCTAAASRGGSRQPGSSGGGRASGGPAPCPLQTLRAASPGGRGRAREARLGPRPRSPPPQRQAPPPPQPRASPGSSRRLPRPPSPGPSALPGQSPGRGVGSSGAAGRGLPGGGRGWPGRRAEAPRALPGGSPAHSPRPGSGPTGRAWAARSDAAVPAWHQGHSARGGGDEGGQPRAATAAPESLRRRRRSGSGLGGAEGCLESIHIFRSFCWTFRPPRTPPEELSSPAGCDFALRSPRLLPGSLCLGGVFAFGAGAGGGSHTRAHAHAQRRTRGSGTGTICSVNAALPLKEAKAALPGKEPAGGRARAVRAEMPGSVRESSAALEPARYTHAHTLAHTHERTRAHAAHTHLPTSHLDTRVGAARPE